MTSEQSNGVAIHHAYQGAQAGERRDAPNGPTAELWTLLDELAARGRAIRQQGTAGAAAARPESADDAAAGGGV